MNAHRQLKLMLQYDFYAVAGWLEVGQVENWVERGQHFIKSDPNLQETKPGLTVLVLILPELLHKPMEVIHYYDFAAVFVSCKVARVTICNKLAKIYQTAAKMSP